MKHSKQTDTRNLRVTALCDTCPLINIFALDTSIVPTRDKIFNKIYTYNHTPSANSIHPHQ